MTGTRRPALLGPGDPPPVTVDHPEREGPLLVVSDHGARTIPAALEQLGLADWVLDEHVAWDIGSGDVAARIAERFGAPLVRANYSRLVVDTNRAPDDPTLCAERSGGISIPGNLGLTPALRRQRIETLFAPYHAAIEAQLDRIRARGVTPAIIAIHSCTPVFDRVVRPWHLGVLWDKDPRIAVPLLRNLGAVEGVCVGDNEPYSGRDPHDYTMDHHGEAARIPHVSIEVRQDLVDTPEGVRHWADLLADALAPILADESLYALLED